MKISTSNIAVKGKTATISRWKRPSNFIGSPELKSITRITMTCGGGLGGAQWDEYVCKVSDIEEGIGTYTRYDGKRIRLNSRYIVKAEDYTLVKADLDILPWKKAGGRMSDPMPDIETKYFLVEDGIKVMYTTK